MLGNGMTSLTATDLIELYGPQATNFAALRVSQRRESGDRAGEAVWADLLMAVDDVLVNQRASWAVH